MAATTASSSPRSPAARSSPTSRPPAEAGLKIVGLNQVIGDRLDTADPQDPSISASVMAPPRRSGERLGTLTLQACEGLDPCDVVYFYGIKGIPLDVAIKEGFDAVTEGSTVNIVAEGEGQYLGPDAGLAAMQDILVATPDFDVVVGADQSMQGAEIALDGRGTCSTASRSSASAAPARRSRPSRTVAGSPTSWVPPRPRVVLAMNAMIEALAGNDLGGIDTALELPGRGSRHGRQRRPTSPPSGTADAGRVDRTTTVRRARRRHQALRRHGGARRGRHRGHDRHRSRHRRRERCRQVHARQDRGRGPPARCRRVARRGAGGPLRLTRAMRSTTASRPSRRSSRSCPARSVVENVYLGIEDSRFGVVDRRALRRALDELMEQSGIQVPALAARARALTARAAEGGDPARACARVAASS